ncbi:hypothetical protein DFH06DRAFT_99725 [Mycena polygramma]|nr:hypothetical protein DFH06DRAFT_99725 [Mycena polygramma]
MPLPRLFHSSRSNEWIAPLVSVSRGLVTVGNCAPFPYLSTALAAGLALLELIETVGKTTDDLKYLAESVVAIMKLLGEEIDARPATPDMKFVQVCVEFNMHLTRLSKDIESMSRDWSSSKFKKYIKVNSIRDEIAQFTRRVSDLRANATLIAAAGTRMDLVEVANDVSAVRSSISRIETGLATVHTPGTSNVSPDLVRLEKDFHALKIGDIRLEFDTARTSEYTVRDGVYAQWTDYKGYVKGSMHTIRVYRGSESERPWMDFLSVLAEYSPSPGLPQLFGFCSSPRLQAIVFHGEFRTLDEYASELQSSHEIVKWEISLTSDFEALAISQRQRIFLQVNMARRFAQVDAQNGRLMIAHVETSNEIESPTWPAAAERFLNWFTFSEPMNKFSHRGLRLVLRSTGDGPSPPSLHVKLRELTILMRTTGYHGLGTRCSLYETLTCRGRVYDSVTDDYTAVAKLHDYEPDMDPAWRVVGWMNGEFHRNNPGFWYPTHVGQRTDDGWTHFIVPLLDQKVNWISAYDDQPHCGYFLDANIGFGTNVPDMPLAWMANSGLFVADKSASRFLVRE